MNRNTLISFVCLLFISVKLFAQADAFSGTWQMEYSATHGMAPINIELQIASSERNILYPAHLKLQCDNFSGDYELLFVKKSSRELAISKNKYPVTEKPFGLGDWPIFLNGIFDLSKDLKGVPILNVNRIHSKQLVVSKPGTLNFDEAEKITLIHLINFLKDAEISLKKINNTPWGDKDRDRILSPLLSPAYFGLLDTVLLKNRDGVINLSGNKKTNNDVVSVALNGLTIIFQKELSKKGHVDDILLDTGLNILALFADNFGSGLPNKGKLNLAFANQKFTLDFTNHADSAATFIVAKLYCYQDKAKETYFQNNIISGGEKPLQKNEKLTGSIIATSQQLTLAIWDDAAEDGDSISINIDGTWIVQGFPVKKNPQYIRVTLKPGANIITFIADNLGSIPPNTSVLEIIDGNKRKSYAMETNPGENNLIRIFYDVNGDKK